MVIPVGVNCQQFRPAPQAVRARLRQELGIPEDALLLGTTARYTLQKDALTVYRATRSFHEVEKLKITCDWRKPAAHKSQY